MKVIFLVVMLVATNLAFAGIMHLQQAKWQSCLKNQSLCYSLEAQDAGESLFSKNIYAREMTLTIIPRSKSRRPHSFKALRGIWLNDANRWLLTNYTTREHNLGGREFYFYPDQVRLEKIKVPK